MKIRNGFVSNSSTSSFILIGEKITKEEAIDEFLKAHPQYTNDEDDYLEDTIDNWCCNEEGNINFSI